MGEKTLDDGQYGSEEQQETKGFVFLVYHYRKRESASYIVREVRSVRERDTEREREREWE